MMKVLLFRDIAEPALAAIRSEFRTCEFRATTDPAQLEDWLAWPEAIFGNAPPALLSRATRLRWLQIVSSGFDEYRSLAGSRVTVTTAHGVHAPVIAQHVLMQFLLFVRAQLHFANCQRQKLWDRRPALPHNPAAQTVGLVGYGAVGRAIAGLLRPLGPRLIATKRTPGRKDSNLDRLYPWAKLDDLLRVSDHVVISLPLTEATRGLFDARRLARLKPGAVLYNIARGSLVDEGALVHQLERGALGGAALDVFEHEPLPAASPLWRLPQVMITPHIAGHHRELGRLLLERFLRNLRRHLRGAPLQARADFGRGY